MTAPPSPFFVTPGDYVDWKTHNEVFQTLSGYAFQSLALTEAAGASGDAELLQLAVTSADFFRTLRARPLLGRTFLPDEDQAGRERVAVLSHGLWTRRFGSERGIVGREIALDGLSHSVIGVMPADFDFPVGAVDAWIPMVVTPVQRNDRRDHSVLTVGRLRRGVSLGHARARMQALGARLAETHPETNTGRAVEVLKLRHEQRGVIGPFVLLGQLAAVFVLLIACANVSNLQVARAAAKGREMAIRAALGAGRWHIGRLVVLESLLLALVATGLGIAVAGWGVGVLRNSVSPEAARWIQGFPHIAVDWTVLGFSLALAGGAGAVSGLVVSSEAWRHAVMNGLREGSPAGTVRRASLRRILVVTEVALAVVVTVSAGQMIQGFQSLASGSRGFSAEGVGTLRIRLRDAGIEDAEQIRAFHDGVVASATAVPGVESAALVSGLPAGLTVRPTVEFRIEGRPEPSPGQAPLADLQIASPDYFGTVGVPLLDGRTFDAYDGPEGNGEATVVVSERLARLYWPGENPLGHRLRVRGDALGGDWWRVVGVVGDVRQNWFEAERPFLYLPATRVAYRQMYLAVRGDRQRAAPVVGDRPDAQAERPEPARLRRTAAERCGGRGGGGRSRGGRGDGCVRCAGAAALRCRCLWGDGLRGEAARAGNGHSPGAGSLARRGAPDDGAPGVGGGGGRRVRRAPGRGGHVACLGRPSVRNQREQHDHHRGGVDPGVRGRPRGPLPAGPTGGARRPGASAAVRLGARSKAPLHSSGDASDEGASDNDGH